MASSREGAGALRFTRPTQQIVLMMIILALVIAGGVLVWPSVKPVFLSAPALNGTITVVFVVGVVATFFQVIQLFSSVTWIEQLAGGSAANFDRLAHIWGIVPSNTRPQPIAIRLSPVKAAPASPK